MLSDPLRGVKGARSRGAALIVALGVLVVLALLGTVFATMTGIERSVARNYIDKVRARLLAESGIEHAIAQLSNASNIDIWRVDRTPPWIYNGGDLNGNFVVDAGDIDKNGDGIPDTNDVPITEALSPSFFLDANADSVPDPHTIGARANVGVSGGTDVYTHADKGNLYAVRVIDLGSKINVNMWHANMAAILNNLGAAIGAPVPADLGDKIVANRPPTRGYADTNELRAKLAAAGVSAGVFDTKIKPFVTTVGWQDTKSVKPVPLNKRRRAGLQAGRGQRPNSDVFAHWEMRPADLFDPIPPTPGGSSASSFGVEVRTPININHAPIEVLVAAIAGLKGYYLFEDRYTTYPYDWHGFTTKYDGSMADARRASNPGDGRNAWINGRVGTIYETPAIPLGTKPTSGSGTTPNGTGAWAIAKAIVIERSKIFQAPSGFTYSGGGPPKNRNFFRSFQQFNEFIDRLDPKLFEPIDGWNLEVWRQPHTTTHVSPPDLVANLVPMVKDVLKANFNPNCHLNELNPEETLGLWVDKTDLTYHTTEFTFFPMGYFEIQSAGWLLDGARRIIAEEVITSEAKVYECWRDTSQWDFMRGWADDGNALSSVFSSNNGVDPTGDGLALRSFPELQDQSYIKKNAGGIHRTFDGYLSLSTVRSPAYGAGLQLRFDDGTFGPFAAEVNRNGQPRGPYVDKLLGGGNPGSMTNEGLLCEREASPSYDPVYFDQHRGAVGMWVKPLFRPENAGRHRAFFSSYYHELAGEPCWTGLDPAAEGNKCPFWTAVSGLFYIANHRTGAPGHDWYTEDEQPVYESGSPGYNWREHTVAAGFGGRYGGAMPNGHEYEGGCSTPCTNHVGHGHPSYGGWSNDVMTHRWVHLAWNWDDHYGNVTPPGISNIKVNGNWAETADFRLAHWTCDNEPDDPNDTMEPRDNTRWGPGGDRDPSRDGNAMWGQPPRIRLGCEADPPLPGGVRAEWLYCNFTADATIDEVLVWAANGNNSLNFRSRPTLGFTAGRFYKEDDATYTSPKVNLGLLSPRLLPPAGTATPPGGATTGAATTAALPAQPVRLGLFAYTGMWPVYVAPAAGETYNPAVHDPARIGPPGTVVQPAFFLAIADPNAPATELMPLQGSAAGHPARLGGCAITNNANPLDPAAQPVVLPGREFRYKVQFGANLANKLNTPLLFSPVLDDITITYYDKPTQFLSWVVGEN